MTGLLQVGIGNAGPEPVAGPGINNATIQDQDGEDKKAVAVADALGSVLHGRFIEWRDARREKEDEWMEALRAYIGKYDEIIESGFGKRSKVFVHLTRTKTLAAYSRIIDLMLGHGRHWDIEPTPEPDLTPERMDEMYAVAEEVQPGVDLSDEEIKKAAVIIAERACDKMRRRIEDQLAEAHYEHLFKSASLEMCIFGSGALKGPVIKRKVGKTWGRDPNGSWNMADKEETVPGIESPSIFDLYPDPYATSIDDCTGIFERHVITAQWFRDLASHPGFDSAAIEEVLAAATTGNHEDYLHETERRRLNGTSNVTATNNRYDVMEYWGQVKGSELSAAGMAISAEQMSMEFQANVWFCGHRTIKANLNPLKPERLPYQICPYERVPNSIWGIGVPMQMRDSQIVINASVRATLDNLGISSGPMLEVNTSLLADGEDPRDLHPWRIFLRSGGDAAHPMIRMYHTNNITNELNNVTEQFRRFADEETSLPSYTHGEAGQGLNKTASGMSMLMGAANVALKAIIKNIDSYLIEPVIGGLYNWNMKYSEDESIKGDMKAIAQGSSSLLAKEIQSQRLIQYAQLTANPIDAQLMGPEKRAGLLRSIALSLDLQPDEVAPDDPKDAAAPQPGQMQVEQAQPGQPGQPQVDQTQPTGIPMEQGMPPVSPTQGEPPSG